MNEQVRIVTFETFYDQSLAYIIMSRLKANRIRCFMADDNFLQLKPYFNQAMGGIKIKVFEKDVDKCIAILAEDPELLEQAVGNRMQPVAFAVPIVAPTMSGTAALLNLNFTGPAYYCPSSFSCRCIFATHGIALIAIVTANKTTVSG